MDHHLPRPTSALETAFSDGPATLSVTPLLLRLLSSHRPPVLSSVGLFLRTRRPGGHDNGSEESTDLALHIRPHPMLKGTKGTDRRTTSGKETVVCVADQHHHRLQEVHVKLSRSGGVFTAGCS